MTPCPDDFTPHRSTNHAARSSARFRLSSATASDFAGCDQYDNTPAVKCAAHRHGSMSGPHGMTLSRSSQRMRMRVRRVSWVKPPRHW